MMDKSRPALYNQAIMDFGALQCVPSSPSCLFARFQTVVCPCKEFGGQTSLEST